MKKEWARIKALHGGARLRYLATYYWQWLLVLLAAVLVISGAAEVVYSSTRKVIFNLAIVDADAGLDAAALSSELLGVLGSGGKREKVSVDISATSKDSESAATKLAIVMSVVADTDAVICNQEVYETFAAEDIFADWQELPAGAYVTYEPAYYCILKKAGHPEEAKALARYLLNE